MTNKQHDENYIGEITNKQVQMVLCPKVFSLALSINCCCHPNSAGTFKIKILNPFGR